MNHQTGRSLKLYGSYSALCPRALYCHLTFSCHPRQNMLYVPLLPISRICSTKTSYHKRSFIATCLILAGRRVRGTFHCAHISHGSSHERCAMKNKKHGDMPCISPQARLTGIEPAHLEPESSALSTELQTYVLTFESSLPELAGCFMEIMRFELTAFRMRTERSPTELYPHAQKIS